MFCITKNDVASVTWYLSLFWLGDIGTLHWGKRHVQAFFKITSHASKFFCQIKHLIWFLSYSLIFVLFWLYCSSTFWCFWVILCIIFCLLFHVHHHITMIWCWIKHLDKKKCYDNLTNKVMRGEYHRWISWIINKNNIMNTMTNETIMKCKQKQCHQNALSIMLSLHVCFKAQNQIGIFGDNSSFCHSTW